MAAWTYPGSDRILTDFELPDESIMVLRLLTLCFDGVFTLLPGVCKRWIGNRWRGWEIAPDAYIGLSFIRCQKLIMGPGAHIGHLNLINRMDEVRLDDFAKIGDRNVIRGVDTRAPQFRGETERRSVLSLGTHVRVTGGHYFDCCNHIRIGAFTIVAGRDSRFFSHGISMRLSQQQSAPVCIGQYCMIGAGCIVLKGSQLPDYSALAAGSTLHKSHSEPYTLYSGVPAQAAGELDPTYQYFSRSHGSVD